MAALVLGSESVGELRFATKGLGCDSLVSGSGGKPLVKILLANRY